MMQLTFLYRVAVILHLYSAVYFVEAYRPYSYQNKKTPPETFVSNVSGVQYGYVNQLVDHFDPLNYDYWLQRYFWNYEFYEAGGPVFINLGGTDGIDGTLLQSGSMMELCKKLQGMAFNVELRFSGESWPIKNTELKSLSYCTYNQALADFADFIQYVTEEFHLEENKIIVVGCGVQAGSLAVYMRQKYPQLVDIVWSSAAALNYEYNFIEYFELIGRVINDISPGCYDTVKQAFADLEKLLWLGCGHKITGRHQNAYKGSYYYKPSQPQTCKIVEDTFTLCEPFDLNHEDDIRNFFEYLAQDIAYVVQYDKQLGDLYTMEYLCSSVFENSTLNLSPIEKLSKVTDIINALEGFECTDFTQKHYCEQLSHTSVNEPITSATNFDWPRPWWWFECSQVGYLQTTDSWNQPFGHSFPALFLSRQCQCVFHQRFTEEYIQNQVRKQMTEYGGIERTKSISRVIFVNGANDPWSPVGILYANQTSCENKVVLIKGASQCFDLLPTHSATDSRAVTAARHTIHSQIERWLREDEISCCPIFTL